MIYTHVLNLEGRVTKGPVDAFMRKNAMRVMRKTI